MIVDTKDNVIEIPYLTGYGISKDGCITDNLTGLERQCQFKHGVKTVKIRERVYYVHKLIMDTYSPRTLSTSDYVRFKDDNKDNLHLDNLYRLPSQKTPPLPVRRIAVGNNIPRVHNVESVDYPGYYIAENTPDVLVNTNGDIISLEGVTRKQSPASGYLSVRTWDIAMNKKRNVSSHRIVAEAFQTPKHSGQISINHINGIRDDNRAENLEWVTSKENSGHANWVLDNYKTLAVQVKDLIVGDVRIYRSIKDCVKMLAINDLGDCTLSALLNNRDYRLKRGRYLFKYINDSTPWSIIPKGQVGKHEPNTNCSIQVKHVETGIIATYPSTTDAAIGTGTNLSSLGVYLHRGSKGILNGYLFRQGMSEVTDWPSKETIDKLLAGKDKRMLSYCIADGTVKEYVDKVKLSFALDISIRDIQLALREPMQRSVRGHWLKPGFSTVPWPEGRPSNDLPITGVVYNLLDKTTGVSYRYRDLRSVWRTHKLPLADLKAALARKMPYDTAEYLFTAT